MASNENEQIELRLTPNGPGSRAEIVEYVQRVIEQRTTPNDDTNAERLARGIVTSVLHRLGAGYSVAIGQQDRTQAAEEREGQAQEGGDD